MQNNIKINKEIIIQIIVSVSAILLSFAIALIIKTNFHTASNIEEIKNMAINAIVENNENENVAVTGIWRDYPISTGNSWEVNVEYTNNMGTHYYVVTLDGFSGNIISVRLNES